MLPIPLNNAIEMNAVRQDSNAEASSDLGIKPPRREGALNDGTLNFVMRSQQITSPVWRQRTCRRVFFFLLRQEGGH
jgi:hypothetical protein